MILTALIGRKLKLILCRQEGSAGHMAAAYAKKTGKPAVVMVTAGPGAPNLVTATATATLEHAPLIAISGQMDSRTFYK
jgi:acetolactate synthase-1/2/3 large subunit